MTELGNDRQIVQKDVMDVLRALQQGYSLRNSSDIDHFMDRVFSSECAILLGTGERDLCVGFEKVKDAIVADWEFWGDLNLDLDNTIIQSHGSIAWFVGFGTVRYTFKDETTHINRILAFANEVVHEKHLSERQKLHQINWYLCHALHGHEHPERSYLWPLRISGVLCQESTGFRIRQIQFTLASFGRFPDLRYDSESAFEHNINSFEKERINFRDTPATKAVRQRLSNFSTDYANLEIHDIPEFVKKYFMEIDSIRIVGTDNTEYLGASAIEELCRNYRSIYDKIHLDSTNALINCQGGICWVLTCGALQSRFTESGLISEQLAQIVSVLHSDRNPREKAHFIHTSTARTLKEASAGPDSIYPIRFEAIFHDSPDGWKIDSAGFSFPFHWTVEEREGALPCETT